MMEGTLVMSGPGGIALPDLQTTPDMSTLVTEGPGNPVNIKTGEGTTEDPYKLYGDITVPEEEGLGVSPVAMEILGGRTGNLVGKYADDLLGALPKHLLGSSQKYADKVGDSISGLRDKARSTFTEGNKLLSEGKASKAEKLFSKTRKTIDKADTYQSGLDNPAPIVVKSLKKIPVIGKYIGTKYDKYIGEAVTDMLSPISGKAAMTSRYNLGQRIIKNTKMSEVDAIRFVEAIWKEREAVLKASRVGQATGTATGALLGGNTAN